MFVFLFVSVFHGNYRDFAGCHQLLSLDLAQNQIATISGNFQGLRGLTKINLIGNDIVCIDRYISHLANIIKVIKYFKTIENNNNTIIIAREALESLTNVEEIEIDLRYLQCRFLHCHHRQSSSSSLPSSSIIIITIITISSSKKTKHSPQLCQQFGQRLGASKRSKGDICSQTWCSS